MRQPDPVDPVFLCQLSVFWALQRVEIQGMWEELGKAFCLMLVFEGIIPFLYPARWRNLVASLSVVSDQQLRTMGLVSMVLGAGLLYLIN